MSRSLFNVYQIPLTASFFTFSEKASDVLTVKASGELLDQIGANLKTYFKARPATITTDTAVKERAQHYYQQLTASVVKKVALDCDPYLFRIFMTSAKRPGEIYLYCRTTNLSFQTLWNTLPGMKAVNANLVPSDGESIAYSAVICDGHRVLKTFAQHYKDACPRLLK